MNEKVQWVFIAWWPHSRRSEMFAQECGGELHCIYYRRLRSPLCAPLRYVLQALRTWYVLLKTRPQVIHVQNPPFICGLVVYFYCSVSAARFVFDHHSAAFARVWDWALPMQKFLSRRAVTNIVTNQHWADVVHSWHAYALIMGDPFRELPLGKAFPVCSGFSIAFVSTFAPDEPLDAVLDAARQLAQVHFYITGDARQQPQSFLDSLPDNVTCTGFLPDDQYIGLLRSVNAIMAFTTRDHTLQLGGCEAVSVGKPLITSDWSFLQSFFSRGTIHVANTSDGIRDGILAMQKNHRQLQEEMVAFRDAGRKKWRKQLARLQDLAASVGKDGNIPTSTNEKEK